MPESETTHQTRDVVDRCIDAAQAGAGNADLLRACAEEIATLRNAIRHAVMRNHKGGGCSACERIEEVLLSDR